MWLLASREFANSLVCSRIHGFRELTLITYTYVTVHMKTRSVCKRRDGVQAVATRLDAKDRFRLSVDLMSLIVVGNIYRPYMCKSPEALFFVLLYERRERGGEREQKYKMKN